jgi:hypothetical protein
MNELTDKDVAQHIQDLRQWCWTQTMGMFEAECGCVLRLVRTFGTAEHLFFFKELIEELKNEQN